MFGSAPLAWVFLLSSFALATPPPITWSFEGSLEGASDGTILSAAPAETRFLTEGVAGKAIVVDKSPVTWDVPAAFLKDGALSFYYRLPPKPADRAAAQAQLNQLKILSLGEHVLTYERNRIFWYRLDKAEAEQKAWQPKHSFLAEDRFVLIEIGWSAEQGCYIFADGLVVARMDAFQVSEQTEGAARLILLAGIFDEMRLDPDATVSGARFKGILARERFDGDNLPEFWLWYNRDWKDNLALIHAPGFNGSPGAMATPPRDGGYFSIYLPLGFFRVTDDTYLCGAFFSSNGRHQTCIVRVWPEMQEHPNNWLRQDIPAGQWHPMKVPLSRWKVRQGWIVQGVSYGSAGPGERTLAVDDICLIRGEDVTPPEKVTGLRAADTKEGVKLEWNPANSKTVVSGYAVYWSNLPQIRLQENEIVGRTRERTFTHTTVTHAGTHYYAVAAVDVFGNTGPASDPVKVDVPE